MTQREARLSDLTGSHKRPYDQKRETQHRLTTDTTVVKSLRLQAPKRWNNTASARAASVHTGKFLRQNSFGLKFSHYSHYIFYLHVATIARDYMRLRSTMQDF